MSIPLVKLRNGSEQPQPGVVVYSIALQGLLNPPKGMDPVKAVQSVMAFYELKEKVRNPDHKFFSEPLKQILIDLQFLDYNGSVRDLARDVVESMVEWEGADPKNLVLHDPIVSA